MAIIEETILDKIEIIGDYRIVQVRMANIIKRNEVEINRSYSRYIITPISDLSNEDPQIITLCGIFYTPALINSYKEHLVNQETII